MRRVLAVVLIATLTTMMIGIDRTSWAGQDRDQEKRRNSGPRSRRPSAG